MFIFICCCGSATAVDVSSSPTVIRSDPVNNSVNVASNKVIKVTFSEQVKGGNNWIELKNSKGTNILISKYISGNVLAVKPVNALAESKYCLLLHTACVTDVTGHPLAATNINFTVGTPLTVTSCDPSNNAINVQPGSAITVTFSKYIKTGTNFIELKASNGKLVNIIPSSSGKVLTINHPTILAYNTKYTLLLHTGCVTDLAGNPLVGYGSSFTTLVQGLVPSNIIANTATMRSYNGKPRYQLPYVVTNYGKTTMYNRVVGIYLTPTKSLTGTKYLIGKQTIKSLAAGKYIKMNTSYIIPSTVPLGSYYITVVADTAGYSFIKTRIIPYNPNY